MSRFNAVLVICVNPPMLHDDDPAIVTRAANGDRMTLFREDMSYASWVKLCHTPIGCEANILVELP